MVCSLRTLGTEDNLPVTTGRRELIAALGGAVVWPSSARAQVGGRKYTIGILSAGNELSVIADFGQYDMRVKLNNEHELFLPDARAAGNLVNVG